MCLSLDDCSGSGFVFTLCINRFLASDTSSAIFNSTVVQYDTLVDLCMYMYDGPYLFVSECFAPYTVSKMPVPFLMTRLRMQ